MQDGSRKKKEERAKKTGRSRNTINRILAQSALQAGLWELGGSAGREKADSIARLRQ